MENATKALVIAASVLIVILLISLGVGIFNTTQEQIGDTDLTEYETQKFNEKFIQFEGESVSGIKVNSMLNIVFNHNQQYDDSVMRVRVGLDGESKWLIRREGFNGSKTFEKVSTSKTYTVKTKIDSKTKLVYQIDVTTN